MECAFKDFSILIFYLVNSQHYDHPVHLVADVCHVCAKLCMSAFLGVFLQQQLRSHCSFFLVMFPKTNAYNYKYVSYS